MKIETKHIFILFFSCSTLLTSDMIGQINIYRFEEGKCPDNTERASPDSLDYLIDKEYLAEKKVFQDAFDRIENKYYSISFMSDFHGSISVYINGRFQQKELVRTDKNFGHALTIKIRKDQKNKEELTCVYGDSLFSFPLNYTFTYYTIYRDKQKSWIIYYSKCGIGPLE